MRKAWTAVQVLLTASTLALWGCGYALVGRASNLPDHIRQVYVEPLVNETPRSEVDQILTRALAEELVTRKRFQIVTDRTAADAVLSGSVHQFTNHPLTFDDQGRATEYQITINVGMVLKEVTEDHELWRNDNYVYREIYPVETAEETYFDRENLAIAEAAVRFARTAVIDVLEGF